MPTLEELLKQVEITLPVTEIVDAKTAATLALLAKMNIKLDEVNNNIRELARLNKLPLYARLDEGWGRYQHKDSKSVAASGSNTVLKIINRKGAIENIRIYVESDTTGTSGASYVGMREFFDDKIIDHGTIYSAFGQGWNLPKSNIIVNRFDTDGGNFEYEFSLHGESEPRIFQKNYELVLYNDDDTAHTIKFDTNIRYLDSSELKKNIKI